MPPADVLRRIVESRRARYELAPGEPVRTPTPCSSFSLQDVAQGNPFVGALRARGGAGSASSASPAPPAVIAEVKLGSPRLGNIASRIDPERQARLYASGGAAALSVVVEPDHFFGSSELLARCKEASGLPAIAKDFLVSERQLDEAAAAGADAFLLIAALHSAAELLAWAGAVRARGMAPLVETHDAEDLAKVAGSSWEMVGINNRDLRTFEVSLAASIALRGSIPVGALAVAESGIGSRADLDTLAGAGFDAFLVGEALLLADDPAAKLAELVGPVS